MLFVCPIHGPTPGVPVCPHLDAAVLGRQSLAGWAAVGFEYRGDFAEGCILCRTCAIAHGLTDRLVLPLPDDYPAWFPTILVALAIYRPPWGSTVRKNFSLCVPLFGIS